MTQHKKSMTLLKWALAGVFMVGIAIAAAWYFLPVDRLLEKQFKQWLAQRGVAAEFSITTLSPSRMEIKDISLADSDMLQVGQLTAEYTLTGLRERRIDSMTIDGLRLTLIHKEDGSLDLGGLDSLWQKSEDAPGNTLATLPPLPFNRLVAENVTLTYKRPGAEPITAIGSFTLEAGYTGHIHITEATVPLQQGELLLSELEIARDVADAPFSFTADSIAHITGKKAWFTPLKAKGELSLARDLSQVEGIITIQDLRELWLAKAEGTYNISAGDWNIMLEQPSMRFETGIVQPDMLFPVLRGSLSQVTGSLSLSATLKGKQAAINNSSGQLTAQNLGAVVMDVPVNGLNGKIKLSSLTPPATQGVQSVTIEEILLGLPLKEGEMRFNLAKDGTARFEPSRWQWAGGYLRTEGAALNIYAPALPDITLRAEAIDLEQLLSGLLQKGVTATGKLSGSLPVHFTEANEAMIQNGHLATDAGGIVRYTPGEDAPLQKGGSLQTDILLSAMENFHYEVLSMNINSLDAQELEVVLHVKGRNPELYNGQTIELNINLTGNLLDIVQSGMNIYSLPERLEEQLSQ